MNPKELKEARIRLGLSLSEMARMLGYSGKNLNTMQRDLENGSRAIREPQRRLMDAYLSGYRPDDWPGEKHKPGIAAIRTHSTGYSHSF